MFPIIPSPGLLATAVIVAAKCMVGNNMLPSSAREDELKSTDDGLKNVNMDELVKKLVEEIKQRSPEVVKAIENISKEEMEAGTFDSIYISQIAAAQEFLNENHNADLSHIQRLLQKMMPERYYSASLAEGTTGFWDYLQYLWRPAPACAQCANSGAKLGEKMKLTYLAK